MDPILTILLPVFAIVATGYLAGRARVLGADGSDVLNRFVYWVALPALLFRAMATAEFDLAAAGRFAAAFTLAIGILWLASLLWSRAVWKLGLAEGAMHALNGVYANVGYMGIPLAAAAYGAEAAPFAITAALIVVGPLIAITAAMLEIAGKERVSVVTVAGGVLTALVKNPLVVSPLLGVAWGQTGIGLAAPIDTYLTLTGAAAGPCALFAIGLFLTNLRLREGLGEVSAMTLSKLVLHPLVTAAVVFWLIPLDPLAAKVAIFLAALPTGAGSFVLAQVTGVAELRTSSVILISTVLSIASVAVIFMVFPPG